LLDELSILGEDLHTRAFTAKVTDHIFSRCANHSDLPRVPKLTFFTTYISAVIYYIYLYCTTLPQFLNTSSYYLTFILSITNCKLRHVKVKLKVGVKTRSTSHSWNRQLIGITYGYCSALCLHPLTTAANVNAQLDLHCSQQRYHCPSQPYKKTSQHSL